MKKLLAIVVLGFGLVFGVNAEAKSKFLCFKKLNDYQLQIEVIKGSCDGYALDSNIDKKFYKYYRSWKGSIGSTSGNSAVLKDNMFRLSANNPDPKFQMFVNSVLGYNFKNHPVRKSAGEQILLFTEMGDMSIDTKTAKTETKETKKKKNWITKKESKKKKKNWITKKEPKKKKKTETTQTQQVAKKENKKEDNPLTEEDLENMQPSQSRLEAIIEFFKESVENKTPIDPDASALQFGYKDFEEFAKEYLKIFELTNISINEIREYLAGTDETVIIDQSQENLDKLYSLILNDKYFKKKNIYFKTFKKGKYGESQVDVMALAVYINYEKEMAKITKNPNLKKISRFTWDWGWSRGAGYAPYSYALEGCEKDAKKYKLFGGECVIVDWRSKVTGEIKNMLKPNLELAKRMGELKKQKLKPKKEKKKEIAKVKVQTEKPKSTVDLIIPVQVYIIQVNEKRYKTTTTPEDVKNDFKVVNSLWNVQGIQFELIDIVKSEGNTKSLKKDMKWVKEKYLKTLQINSKKGTIKSDESKRVKYWQILHKLIKGTTNRNKNAINLFYVPYLPGQFMCGVAYSYSAVIDSSLDSYKRKNAGYAIIGEQSVCESGKTVAHELGHMFSLGHKETTNVDLMMWGDGERINSWQANKIRKYHNKYLKRTLALN